MDVGIEELVRRVEHTSFLFRPFNEEKLSARDERLGRLAPVLNRAFTTSSAVRLLAELVAWSDDTDVEYTIPLSPADVEALLGAIVTLARDLNNEVCRAADLLNYEDALP